MFWTIEDVKKPPSRRDPDGIEPLRASRHSTAGIAALAGILFGCARFIYQAATRTGERRRLSLRQLAIAAAALLFLAAMAGFSLYY